MTALEFYEYTLIEINKVEAPSLLLDDFNYFANKAILNYTSAIYTAYDVNQLTSDILRCLKSTTILDGTSTPFSKPYSGVTPYGATYVAELPRDYFHILSCIVEFKRGVAAKGCSTTLNELSHASCRRLTADMFTQVLNNYYLRPSVKNPYFYIHNSTEPSVDTNNLTDPNDQQRLSNDRKANPSDVQIEIRYGKDDNVYSLNKIYVDYLKIPKYIELTHEQIDAEDDLSQVLEFPEHVCYEIIKEIVKLVLENSSDPRLNSNIPVNASSLGGQSQQRSK